MALFQCWLDDRLILIFVGCGVVNLQCLIKTFAAAHGMSSNVALVPYGRSRCPPRLDSVWSASGGRMPWNRSTARWCWSPSAVVRTCSSASGTVFGIGVGTASPVGSFLNCGTPAYSIEPVLFLFSVVTQIKSRLRVDAE